MFPSPISIFRYTLNCVSLISAVVIALLVLHFELNKPEVTSVEAQKLLADKQAPAVGTTVQIDGVTLGGSTPTLVIAMKNDCAWNLAAAMFYREVVLAEGPFKVLGVTPDSPATIEGYWKSLQMPPLGFRQVDIKSLGILATPALVLIDKHGRVSKSWIGGVLSISQQAEIRHALGMRSPKPPSVAETTAAGVVTVDELKTLLRQRDLPIVDIRPREKYDRSHVVGSISMPMTDVLRRALFELPLHDSVVV